MRTPTHPARKYRHVLLAAMLTLVACGDEGPTGPSDDFDIVGEWSWRVDDATAPDASCSVTDVTLTFTRAGGALTGHRVSAGGGNVSCTIHGSSSTSNYSTNDEIDDLSHGGTDISFTFATTHGTWEMDGEIETDNSMGGAATIRLGTSIGVFVLTGPWRATRN